MRVVGDLIKLQLSDTFRGRGVWVNLASDMRITPPAHGYRILHSSVDVLLALMVRDGTVPFTSPQQPYNWYRYLRTVDVGQIEWIQYYSFHHKPPPPALDTECSMVDHSTAMVQNRRMVSPAQADGTVPDWWMYRTVFREDDRLDYGRAFIPDRSQCRVPAGCRPPA
ncbi:hypothetical protein J6590_062361 [Homalodisca vitripennis]|nr:hypothetical protein J6590_062361 [Homalodisca vitripennis]